MSSRQKQETPRHSLSRTHINTDVETRSPILTFNKPLTFVPDAEGQALGTPEAGAGSMTEARKVSRHRC